MRLILIGPPGSGKGTQAQLLTQRDQAEHISTGDLLRAGIREQTAAGLQAKTFYDAGKLVPDPIVNELVAERFRRDDRPKRFLMDGYPRTLGQAQTFDRLLASLHLPLTAVVLVDVADDEIVHRIGGRLLCPNPACKATYHTETKPPKVAGVCDLCGTALGQRADDKPETVRARLGVYHRDTAEVIPYYREQGLLREVSGVGQIEEVYARIAAALNG